MSIQFDFAATVDRVFALMTDADFLVDRCLALGEISAECTIEDADDEIVVSLNREVERKLPAFLAHLFTARQTVDVVERWTSTAGSHAGKQTVTIHGQSVEITAVLLLEPQRGGCSYHIEHTVSAHIPLIGRQVEKYIREQIETGARQELEYLAGML